MEDFEAYESHLREDTLKAINSAYCRHVKQLESLWIKMFGQRKHVFMERYQIVRDSFVEMMEEMISQETEAYQEMYRTPLINLLQECKNLERELSLKIEIPFTIDVDGINLQLQCKNLSDCLEKYEKIKADRLKTLDAYKKEEQKLCKILGSLPQFISLEEVPSEEKLEEIKKKISSLTGEKLKREKIYKTLVKEIKQILKDLDITEMAEYKVALNNTENFVLSEENLLKLEEYKMNLCSEMELEVKLIAELKEKVLSLWNRLDVGAEERDQILMKANKSCSRTVREIWEEELKRCEVLKRINIENVILRCRTIIEGLWNDCHIGKEERRLFTDYYSNEFNEELLKSHENKEMELRKYSEKNRELLTSVEKWFSLWDKMRSLENQSNFSERLNNRGGQLLKEEKERNRIQKLLPNEELKLKKLTAKFEAENGVPFKYDGKCLMALIEDYWERRKLEKENEKKIRKVQNSTSGSTPLKVNRPVTPASGVLSRKRGRPLTPIDNTATKSEIKRQFKLPPKSCKERRRSRSHEPVSQKTRNPSRLLRYDSFQTLPSVGMNSADVSYYGFQTYFENKNKAAHGTPLRSSLSPSSTHDHNTDKTNTIFKTSSSTAKLDAKRTRLNTGPTRFRHRIIF